MPLGENFLLLAQLAADPQPAVGMSPLILLILPVIALLVLGVRRRIGFLELLLVVLALVALALFGAEALSMMTSGRAGFFETFPWLAIGGTACAAAWIMVRTRARPRVEGRSKASQTAREVSSRSHIVEGASGRPDRTPSAARADAAIFISYRRVDSSDVVGRIYDRLVQHFGDHSTFKDVDSIPLGVDFRKQLSDSVGQCRVLLAVIGKEWLTGAATQAEGPIDSPREYVRIEIEAALKRGIPIIPLLVQGAAVPSDEQLPSSLQPLAYLNGMAIRPDPDFNQDIARLIKGIEAHLTRSRHDRA